MHNLTVSNPGTRPDKGPLAFARAVCVLKASEAQVPCYEIPPDSGPIAIVTARAASKADGFDDIVVSGPADLLALSTRIPCV